MSVESVAIKGVKTEGKYSLKGFEKNGKFISKDTLSELGDFLKSEPIKKVLGIGLTVGALYLFGPAIITAGAIKGLALDPLLGKNPNVVQSVMDTVRGTNEILRSVSDPVLEGVADITKGLGKDVQDLGR